MRRMYGRLIVDAVLLLSIFLFPFWLTFTLSIVFLIVFDNYIEGIVAGLIMDLTYGVRLPRYHEYAFVASTSNALLYALVLFLKTKFSKPTYATF
jgi:hypothetical protein